MILIAIEQFSLYSLENIKKNVNKFRFHHKITRDSMTFCNTTLNTTASLKFNKMKQTLRALMI